MSAQEKALRELTEQVDRQRKQLELQTAQLTAQQPGLPRNIADIMTGKTIPTSQPEPAPYNMMNYLKRSIASKQAERGNLQAPPLPPSLGSPTAATAEPIDRPKISFSLSGSRPVAKAADRMQERESAPPTLYLPPPSHSSSSIPPHSHPPSSVPPPPGVGHIPLPATASQQHAGSSLADPRLRPSQSATAGTEPPRYGPDGSFPSRNYYRPDLPSPDRPHSDEHHTRWRNNDPYYDNRNNRNFHSNNDPRGRYDNRSNRGGNRWQNRRY